MAWNSDAYLAGSYDAPAPAGKRTTDLDVDAILQEEGAAHLKPIVQAIYGQESSSGSNPRTSIDGARGGMQVIPATFRRFAREGEAIDNPADNMRAGVRYIKFLGDQFGNDPARIAAGYFSGEGNVAKTGDSPFIQDRADGNGTRVSQYVPGVLKRMAGAVVPSAQAAEKKKEPAAQDNILSWDQVAASPDYQAMDGDQKDAARRQYFADVVAPKVPTPDIDSAWAQFDQDTRPAGVGKRVLDALTTPTAGEADAPLADRALAVGKQVLGSMLPDMRGPRSVMDGYKAPTGASAGTQAAPVSPLRQDRYQQLEALARLQPKAAARVAQQDNWAGTAMKDILAKQQQNVERIQSGKNISSPTPQEAAANQFAPRQTELSPGGEDNPKIKYNQSGALGRGVQVLGGGVAQGVLGLQDGSLGVSQLMARLVGAEGVADAIQSRQNELRNRQADQALPADADYYAKMGQGAVASIVQNVPGLATGAEAPALATMGLQSFGQEFGNGRAAGLDNKDAAARAGIYAAAEILGEKFGLGDTLKGLKAAAHGVPTNELARYFGTALMKEVPGEQLTSALEFGTDKFAPFGLNKDATLGDYLQVAGDTLTQTLMQGGMMMTGASGASAAVRGADALRDKLDPNGAALRELNGLVEGGQFDAAATDRYARAALDPNTNDLSEIPAENPGFLPDRGGNAAPGPEPATPAEAPEADSVAEAIPPATNPIAEELAQLSGIQPEGVQNEEDSQAPQGPAQDGANPVAPEGGAGSDAGGLSVGGAAQRDVPGQEVNEADQVARRATGIAEARVVPVESLSSAREGGGKGPGISREAGSLASTIAWMSGKQAVFYTGGHAGPDALVNLAHPQQIFINADSNEATALHATAGHEIGHLIKREAPEAFGPFMQVVKSVSNIDMDSDAGLLAYAPEYWRESAPLIDKMRQAGATDAAIVDALLKEHGNGYTREQLREEFYQDVFGNRFREKGFWQNVIREMARTDMSLLQKFRQVLDQIIQAVSNHHSQGFAADKFISDLKAVRDAAARTYVEYAGRDGMRQKIAKMTPAELLVTKKSHPDGIVKDLAAAELKRRETDAAYAQREAQKDAERDAIADDTLAIRGKALEQQDAVTRAGGFDEAGKGAMAQALSGAKQDKRAERGRAVAEVRRAKERARAAAKTQAAQLEDNEQGLYSPQRQPDLFQKDFANKKSLVTRQVVVSSKGATEKVRQGNVNSAGRMIAPTKQALKNFWKWYGDGPTDAKGRPVLLYHSTNADISEFQAGRESSNNYGLFGDVAVTRSGIFATPDPAFSQEYLRSGDGKNVMPVYMALQNPFDIRDGVSEEQERELVGSGISSRWLYDYRGHDWEMFDNNDDGGNDFVDALKSLGYDGAIIIEEGQDGEAHETYVAFSPEQIKSAAGNLGTFNTASRDVRYSTQRQGATRENATQEARQASEARLGQGQVAPVGAQAVRTDARGDGTTRRADRGDAQQRGPGAAGDTLQGGNGHAGLPPAFGRARRGAVQVRGTHFSPEARQTLSTQAYGRGLKGAERGRLADPQNSDIRPRSFFYVDEGRGVYPEAGVGAQAHDVDLQNVYDLKADPLGYRKLAAGDESKLERLVMAGGFDGYYAPGIFGQQGVAVILGNHSIPVRHLGTQYARGATGAGQAPSLRKVGLLSSEIRKFNENAAAIQAAAPSAALDDSGGLAFKEEDAKALAEWFPHVAKTDIRNSPVRVNFEVAPDPNDTDLAKDWNALPVGDRQEVSTAIARRIVPEALGALGVGGRLTEQVGSYLDDTNPSFALLIEDPARAGDAAKLLGYVLSQDSMMAVGDREFPGADKVGAVTIEIGQEDPAAIYAELRKIEVGGERPVAGQSTVNGQMVVLNYSDLPSEQLAAEIDKALGGQYPVYMDDAFASFPSKEDYGYDSNRQEGAAPTGRSPLEERADSLRAEASDAIRRAIAERSAGRQDGLLQAGQDQQVLKSPQRQAAALWNALSQHEDIYQFPRSEADSLAGVLSEVAPQFKVSERHLFSEKETRQGLAKKFVVKTADGKEATVYQNKQGELWVNASALKEGQSGGSRLYAGLLNYAYNNGLKFIGDPLGVSDAAIFRRTENMLASALKFGTTEHMAPAKEQQTPGLYAGAMGHRDGVVDKFASMKWKEGDDLANLESLLHVSYTNITRFVPEIKNVYYDFKSGEFRWSGDARAVTDREWGDLGDALATRLLGAGLDSLPGALGGTGQARRQGSTLPAPQPGVDPRSVSLKRVALSHTLLREPSEEGRRAVLGEVSRLVQGASLGGLKGVLYSPQRLVVPDAIVANTLGEASKDADHDLAKAGGKHAALRLALKLVTDDLVGQLKGVESPIVLGVVSIEATGRNALPQAAAAVLADRLGGDLDTDVVQADRPRRTSMDGLSRIFARPNFSGDVQAGRNYILVDDTLTQGGTFAALANHITQGGGNVAAVVALTGKQYSRVIQPSEPALSALRAKYGNLEDDFRKATGYGFDGLTESEARYLTNFKPAESVRARILEEAGKDTGRLVPEGAKGQETLASPQRKLIQRLDAAIDGLSNLPDQFDYLKDRYLALGRIARVDEIAAEIKQAFKHAGSADKQAVYTYLTDRAASPSIIGPADLRSMAQRIKKTINYVGDQLVARGLLDPASRAQYRDQYLPRLYLKHLLSEQEWKILGAGKKPSDLGYLKHRKDIAPEVRELILGEVKDPAFLSANAIGRAMRDVALLDWLGTISQNQKWVFPGVMVKYRGQTVSAYWLKAEAERIENQLKHYTPANQVKAKALVDDMRQVATAALGNLDIDHKLFRQIPDTHRYGLLRGMWVRKEIYQDIMGLNGVVNADPTWFEQFFGIGHIGTRLTQYWKFSKVAANPPGQIRNFVSNMVMLQLSGVGLHKMPVRVLQAAREIINNGPYWKVAKKYGVTESTFTAQELYKIKRDLVDLEASMSKMNPLTWVKAAAIRLFDGMGAAYQFAEALCKTIKIIDEMKAGKSEAEAAIEAQKWLFDYSLVPQWARVARNSPVGTPFITYQIKVLPRLLEVATTAPWRLLPWMSLLYGMQYYVASLFGVDSDDLDKLKKALPKWLQDRGHVVLLPFKDAEGRLQVADVGYFFPWTWYSTAGKHLVAGNAGQLLKDDIGGQFSAPVIGAANALMSNYDTFTHRPIFNESDPTSYQAAAIANYLYDFAVPPIISSHGVASPMGLADKQYGGKLWQATTGTTNKFGDPKATTAQAVAAGLGLNFYGMDPDHTRVTNMQVMLGKVSDAEKALKKRLMDQGLTDAERQKAIADYRERMGELAEEAKKYAAESEVPEQLKAKK